MLVLKKGEYISLMRNSNVIYKLSLLFILIILLNNYIQISEAKEISKTDTKFGPYHIETTCVQKCPDQVSV